MTHPYQATVIRYVHDVVTGESLNIGLVLYSPGASVFEARFLRLWSRITGAFPEADQVHLRRTAALISDACGVRQAALQSELRFSEKADVHHVVREFLPADDAAIQLSPIVSGVTDDARRTLDELFEQYVGRYIDQAHRESRDDETIWREFARLIDDQRVLSTLKPAEVTGRFHHRMTFQHTYRNGALNAVFPVSFDLVEADTIRNKSSGLYGRLDLLDLAENDVRVQIVLGLPGSHRPREVRQAAKDGVELLQAQLGGRVVVYPEAKSTQLISKIRHDLDEHDA